MGCALNRVGYAPNRTQVEIVSCDERTETGVRDSSRGTRRSAESTPVLHSEGQVRKCPAYAGARIMRSGQTKDDDGRQDDGRQAGRKATGTKADCLGGSRPLRRLCFVDWAGVAIGVGFWELPLSLNSLSSLSLGGGSLSPVRKRAFLVPATVDDVAPVCTRRDPRVLSELGRASWQLTPRSGFKPQRGGTRKPRGQRPGRLSRRRICKDARPASAYLAWSASSGLKRPSWSVSSWSKVARGPRNSRHETSPS